MKAPDEKMRWSIEQRLQFIEFRLYWEGHVNRGDLRESFGISIPQASSDFTRYQELAPDNLIYDKSAKTYLATPVFDPLFLKPSARQYLAQLRLIADDALTETEHWLGWVPPFDVVLPVRRRLNAPKFQRVMNAVRTEKAIRIYYQSFSRPEPTWRWITPHALGFDGFRWHARAWCHRNGDFRDFVMARMLEIAEEEPHKVDQESDLEWSRFVTLRLGPHPGMESGIRQAIELDYGMKDGAVEITTRICLSYYLERQLGLDLDPKYISPSRQQVILLNRNEVEEARSQAHETKLYTPQPDERFLETA